MNFSGVPVEYLSDVWGKVEPYLRRACQRNGEYETDDLLRALLLRDMQMWVAFEGGTLRDADIFAVCITEIAVFPRSKSCMILVGTGKRREEWQGFITHIEDWARSQGCNAIKAIARPGWERVHKDYRKTHSLLEKVL